jgi:hypothetical protein
MAQESTIRRDFLLDSLGNLHSHGICSGMVPTVSLWLIPNWEIDPFAR